MRNSYQPGTVVFGDWVIQRKIGSGSYGGVYEVHRSHFGEYQAALKVITIPQSDEERSRLLADGHSPAQVRDILYGRVMDLVQEFSIMSRLAGVTNIVSYEDHKVIPHPDGLGWDILIRMELLTPLLEYAMAHPLSRRDVIQLGIDMCRALERCQKHDIIHRDIKPENIFVSSSGDFKLGDFGIAKILSAERGNLSQRGTPNYMAPEVFRGREYGFEVDLYSLGLVLYRFLNRSRMPFLPLPPAPVPDRLQEQAFTRRISGDPLPRPIDADDALWEIVQKAAAYQPSQRYASPQEMRQDLEAVLSESNAPSSADKTPAAGLDATDTAAVAQKAGSSDISAEGEEREEKERSKRPDVGSGKRRALWAVGITAALVLVIAAVFLGSAFLGGNQIPPQDSTVPESLGSAAPSLSPVPETTDGPSLPAETDPSPAETISLTAPGTEGIVADLGADEKLRVYDGPGEGHREIAALGNGDRVVVIAESGEDWYLVAFQEESGGYRNGYVGQAHIALTDIVVSPIPTRTPGGSAVIPTDAPTGAPDPTGKPTPESAVESTAEPSAEPTAEPTMEPTAEPTPTPTPAPTAAPPSPTVPLGPEGGLPAIFIDDLGVAMYYIEDIDQYITMPIRQLEQVTNEEQAVAAVQAMTDMLTDEQKKSPGALEVATVFAESAIAQAKRIGSWYMDYYLFTGGNFMSLSGEVDWRAELDRVADSVTAALTDGGIQLQRKLARTLVINFGAVSATSLPIKVKMDTLSANDNIYRVRFETSDFALTLNISDLEQYPGETFDFQISMTEIGDRGVEGSSSEIYYTLPVGLETPATISVPVYGRQFDVTTLEGKQIPRYYNLMGELEFVTYVSAVCKLQW